MIKNEQEIQEDLKILLYLNAKHAKLTGKEDPFDVKKYINNFNINTKNIILDDIYTGDINDSTKKEAIMDDLLFDMKVYQSINNNTNNNLEINKKVMDEFPGVLTACFGSDIEVTEDGKIEFNETLCMIDDQDLLKDLRLSIITLADITILAQKNIHPEQNKQTEQKQLLLKQQLLEQQMRQQQLLLKQQQQRVEELKRQQQLEEQMRQQQQQLLLEQQGRQKQLLLEKLKRQQQQQPELLEQQQQLLEQQLLEQQQPEQIQSQGQQSNLQQQRLEQIQSQGQQSNLQQQQQYKQRNLDIVNKIFTAIFCTIGAGALILCTKKGINSLTKLVKNIANKITNVINNIIGKSVKNITK
ncbi:hypothetical protein [Lyticum sinuosum]|uniref:Uncharacterized protein n=1 Tax=Lyticum sinuosum TaxID=1332059 RepID=A0AAE4VKC7_9RICK|nr:hypothetical protein [Lyticum sinuosum]MDZ5761120.1 hypothetical protein [Lyticum sinuosum]